MPIIYRPRASSVVNGPIHPDSNRVVQLADVDESIALSDLVRTGEASRLRRRGAMRIDHGLNVQSGFDRAPTRARNPAAVNGSPTWESDPEDRDGNFGSGPVFARNTERERGYRYGYSRANQSQAQRDSQAQAMRRHELESEEPSFILFCGGEEAAESDREDAHLQWSSTTPYEPSLLPLYPSSFASSSADTSHANRASRQPTTGCGALLHMHAAPRKRLGVWTAKHEATAAVVSLDPSYFDRAAVAKIVRSACGCVREGVGCAVCGNPLGTRYKPCRTAADGIFNSRPRPSGPIHPEGPRYWHAHSHSHPSSSSSASSRASNSTGNFYVYTFFSGSVTSSPSCSFPLRSTAQHHSGMPQQSPGSTYQQFQVPLPSQRPPPPQRQQQYREPSSSQRELPTVNVPEPGRSMIMAQGPLFDNDSGIYDRIVTASPTPLSEIGENDREVTGPLATSADTAIIPSVSLGEVEVEVDIDGEETGDGDGEGYTYQFPFQPPDSYAYQYATDDSMMGPPVVPMDSGVGTEGMITPFDPDGEFIVEPNSPDKTAEMMLPPF